MAVSRFLERKYSQLCSITGGQLVEKRGLRMKVINGQRLAEHITTSYHLNGAIHFIDRT